MNKATTKLIHQCERNRMANSEFWDIFRRTTQRSFSAIGRRNDKTALPEGRAAKRRHYPSKVSIQNDRRTFHLRP